VALGLRDRPVWVNPILEVLQKRGLDYEKGYVESQLALFDRWYAQWSAAADAPRR